MKILIIGASGFIGSHLVNYFIDKGEGVTACDIKNLDCKASEFLVLDPDLQDFSHLFRGRHYDFCINASGSASVPFSIENPAADFRLNVSNVYLLLHAIRNFNPDCGFINFSSAAVYGNPASLPVNENMAPSPLSPYGFHKMISEQICNEFYKLYNIKTVSLRVFSAFGPGLRKQLFWDLHQKRIAGKEMELFGTGRESRDFIYISDLCLAVNSVVEKAELCGQAINISSGEEIPVSRAVTTFLNAYDGQAGFKFTGEEKKGDPVNWRADIGVLKSLGFRAQISFDEGIKKISGLAQERIIRIAFFGYENFSWTGGLNYLKNLLLALSLQKEGKVEAFIFVSRLADPKAIEIFRPYAKVVTLPSGGHSETAYKIIDKITGSKRHINYVLRKYRIDLVSHSHKEGIERQTRVINWIPDFQHVHLPGFFSAEENKLRDQSFNNKIEQADLVVLSSGDALKDFSAFAPKQVGKARVLQFVSSIDRSVYALDAEDFKATRKKYQLPEKFFYLPNQFWAHKNHKVVVDALEILKKKGISITVVCTGNMQTEEISENVSMLKTAIVEKGLEQNMLLLGLVSYQDVQVMLRFSVSVLNPSLFEGWSSTVEECKSLGKNMIISDIAVHREQAPLDTLFFDPHQAAQLSELLEKNWLSKEGGPDHVLEKKAGELLESRLSDFGKQLFQDNQGAVMTGAPLVSIITPSYNQGQYLEETILSVLNQSYSNIEYIVIDGGSTDTSPDIIKKYQDRISYWISEKDQGQSDAINKGFKKAKGEYICWVNSDDILYPGFISERVEQFSNNPGVEFIYGDVDQGRDPLQPVPRKGKKTDFVSMLRHVDVPVPQQSAVWKKEVLSKVDPLGDKWHVLLDRVFFMDIAMTSNILYVPGSGAFFRNHDLSKSMAESMRWTEEMPQYYEALFQRMPQEYLKYKSESMTNVYLFCAAIARENGSAKEKEFIGLAKAASPYFYYRNRYLLPLQKYAGVLMAKFK